MSCGGSKALCACLLFVLAPLISIPVILSDECEGASPSPYKWIEYDGQSAVIEPSSAWDKNLMVCGCLLYDGATYSLYYTGKNTTGYSKLGLVTSNDTKSGWTFFSGNPVLWNGSGTDWDAKGVWGPCVLLDGSTYKMWYGGYNGSNWSIGYATSADGQNWTRHAGNPVLGPGASGGWEQTHVYYPYVVRDGGGYRMWYTGYNSTVGAIGYATSSDGTNWTRYPGNPVLGPRGDNSFDGTSVLAPCVLNTSGEYRMYFTGYDGTDYGIGYANSTDSTSWTRYNTAMLTTGSSWEGYLHRNSAAIFNGSAYLMMYTAGIDADCVGEAEGWNKIPLAPEIEYPANSTFTTNSTPVVGWSFHDGDQGDTQTGFQLQFDEDPAFSSVVFDTGKLGGANSSCRVPAALPDGVNYFRVRTWDDDNDCGLWSKMWRITIDTTPPSNPTRVDSSSHTVGQWSGNNNIKVAWSGASDATSGVAGYSTLWDYSADTLPDEVADCKSNVLENTSPPMLDSPSVYFHIRAVDTMGLPASDAAHLGPFKIDRSPPTNPVLGSSTHRAGSWSNLSIVGIGWSGANGTTSNISGYSFVWDNNASTLPDTKPDCNASVTAAASPGLAEGSWYFHIRSVDESGNWAQDGTHFGPVLLDYTPPWNPLKVSSPGHSPGVWSGQNRVQVMWSGSNGTPGGPAAYSCVWDNSSGTVPDEYEEFGGAVLSATSPPLDDGTNHFFHIRVRDAAGNWNLTAVHCGPFWIDSTPPANPANAGSVSHVPGQWSRNESVEIDWSWPASGADLCGYRGASILWDEGNSSLPDLIIEVDANATSTASPPLSPGLAHYFHLRTQDRAGNWATEAVHLGPFLIDNTPPVNPAELASTDHAPLEWSGSNTVNVTWSAGDDRLSGVAGFSYEWSRFPDTLPPENLIAGTTANATASPALADGSSWYFHLRTADRAGNWAPLARHLGPFFIDTAPPDIRRFQINDSAAFSASPNVNLTLDAADPSPGSGQVQMRFALDFGNWTSWEQYACNMQLSLNATDGPRTVAVQVADRLNNTSPRREATILLDLHAPAVSALVINGGAGFTNSTAVTMRIAAADFSPGSGVVEMALGPGPTAWGDWEPFTEDRQYGLSAGDGEKEVCVKVRDQVGLESAPFSTRIVLDSVPPGATSLSLDGGAGITRNATVALDIHAVDPEPCSGLDQMSLSEDGLAWTEWEPFQGFRNYTFPPGDGQRTVLFRAKDRAGNVVNSAGAAIILDTRSPEVLRCRITGRNATDATLEIALSEPACVVLEYGESTSYNLSSISEGYQTVHVFVLAGLRPGTTYHYSFSAADRAGNPPVETPDAVLSIPVPPKGPADSSLIQFTIGSTLALALVLAAIGVAIFRRRRRPAAPRPGPGGEPDA